MNLQDFNILKKMRKGDLKSFEDLFHKYYPGMCSYAEAILKNDLNAEEVVQDIFFNIWKNRMEMELRGKWESYLFKAVYNNSMLYLRKRKREVLTENELLRVEGYASDPGQELQLKEIGGVIKKTLDELPERTREIYHLNRTEGLKYAEIAEMLSISVKTVEANMSKALKALRLSLREYSS